MNLLEERTVSTGKATLVGDRLHYATVGFLGSSERVVLKFAAKAIEHVLSDFVGIDAFGSRASNRRAIVVLPDPFGPPKMNIADI